jgi:hypothetical protein
MSVIDIQIHIPAVEYRKHYRAPGATVLARATDGRSVSLPAGVLQRFVTHDGVHGLFRVEIDAAGRLRSIVRL